MAQNIMLTAFRWLKTLCEQRFDGSKHYVSRVSVAQNKIKITFRGLKTLFKQRFDGSKHYVNSVYMAPNIL